jgi:ribosomal-protein-alanine N-acetyltransferase
MRRLFLEMRDGNVAEALYRRHGFTSIARRRHYYRRGSHSPRDAITFALAIGGVQS